MRMLPIAALVMILGITSPAAATPTDFNFKDVEISEIFQTVAVLGKFNVIVDPQCARAKMNVSLKQVEPLDALFAIAKMQELHVKRIRWEEGSTTVTYAIGRPDKIERNFEHANSRTLQVRFARAADVAAILEAKLPKSVNLAVNHDARTNRLVLHAPEAVLGSTQQLVADLDLPVPTINAKLTMFAGSPEKPSPVWSGTALVAQGIPGRVQLALGNVKPQPTWRVVKIAGDLLHRVNSDDFCSVTVVIDAVLDKNGTSAEVRFVTEVQVKDGEETIIGTMEVAPGEVVQLRMTPELIKTKFPAPPPEPKDLKEPRDPASGKPDPLQREQGLDLEGL
jgi:hypothetical protein